MENRVLTPKDGLISIANSLRTIGIGKENMTWEDLITKANEAILNNTEILPSIDIPDYVKKEAVRVANAVEAIRADNSIVFLAMSDNHHYAAEGTNANGLQTDESNLHANMAAKILAYALDMDFVAHTGDVSWGNYQTEKAQLEYSILQFSSYFKEALKGIPCFLAIGNHDSGIYNHKYLNGLDTDHPIDTPQPGNYLLSSEFLYNNFTNLTEDTNTAGEVIGSKISTNGGYCYRDFTDKKLRVFLLNTSESLIASGEDSATLEAQRTWLSDNLIALNNKDDASEWSFIILSHYPADYGGTMPLSTLLESYIEGTGSFAGKNMAKMIAQFHGHIHNFLTSKLYNANQVQYDAWRVCIPNGQFNRENYYSTLNSYPNISFAQEVNYSKTPETAEETSFVVNVINPTDKIIYSITYGAGPEQRIISYGDTVYYNIVTSLSNVTLSNNSVNVEAGKPYEATVELNDHCAITSIAIVMNNEDITSSVYNNGTILIPEVTGNINITIKAAIQWACTNQIPISTNSSGTIYNGVGYKAKVYDHDGTEKIDSSVCLTGFIPCAVGNTIRIQNMYFNTTANNCRLTFYNSEKAWIGTISVASSYFLDNPYFSNGVWKEGGMGMGVKDSNDNYIQFNIVDSNKTTGCAFVRISAMSITESSIATINEEIQYADEVSAYSITNTLTNVINNNSATEINYGESYQAILTAVEGYELSTVQILMGGVNITDTVYGNGIINIPSVTGAIAIVAKATSITISYTNQIKNSTPLNDSSLYQNGYAIGYYVSSGSAATETVNAGINLTGLIECSYKDSQIIRMKNIVFDGSSSYQRITVYNDAKEFLQQIKSANTGMIKGLQTDADGNWIEFYFPPSNGSGDLTGMKYFNVSSNGLDENSIITINDPIE